jgi:WD40 repeat protein/serine/threonine protein kinase/DNA-binding XRE family transcriptional regulator
MDHDISFGNIVKEHRQALDLTQAELARRVACATITIRKIEANALRPSIQIAERLATSLKIPLEDRAAFVRLARTSTLKTPTPQPLPTPPPTPDEIGLEDLSGRAIRGYELGDLMGEGGFGVVYRAIQPLVEREVAVKIILPRYADHPEFIRRFEAEAQLVARLEHPHIVPLYDYWREPGAAFLVMRLMRGGSLHSRLKEGPLTLDFILRLLNQVGGALFSAHRMGVIHRDLKPANILLDEDENTYLADFGVAKNLASPEQTSDTMLAGIIGSPAYVSPEQIRAEPVQPQADIYALGVLLFQLLTGRQPFQGPTPIDYVQQHLNQPIPPLLEYNPNLPPSLEPVLSRATAKTPINRYPNIPSLVTDFQSAVTSAGVELPPSVTLEWLPADQVDLEDIENPYKGLRAFEEADAENFFGRETLIQDLLGRMGEENDLSRFLAVVGPSGSGKSSAVKAGLIPSLRRGGLPGSENWFIVELTPGSHPFEELETALLRVAVNPPESLLGQLRQDERGLLRAMGRILPPDKTVDLLLVVDQFEELFTLVEDEDTRAGFLESLLSAILDPRSRLRIVITLRADFTDRPLEYVDFGELLRQRTEFVLPLTPDELEQAIVHPARQAGLALEPGLSQRIIRDLGDQPGALPLLQYALTELFERRVGRRLTLQAYQDSGGVLGALGKRAEEIYTALDPSGQASARQVFLRLVTLGEGVEDTRRRVLKSELESLDAQVIGTPSRTVDEVLDSFGRARLLSFDRDHLTRGPTVEVAHEALLREWSHLREWLDQSRADIRTQRVLGNAAADWLEADQDTSFLLRGSRLDQFSAWVESTDLALTQVEADYLDASLAERRAREAAEAERLAREATLERRSRNFLRGLVAVLTVAAVIAVALSLYAFNQQGIAESEADARATAQTVAEEERAIALEQKQLTQARELAYASANTLAEDPERSVLLALEAVKTKNIIESINALHQALPELSVLNTIQMEGFVDGIDFNSDGTKLAMAGFENVVLIWDVSGDQIASELKFPVNVPGQEVDYSPDDSLIAASGLTGQADLTLWDASTGEVLHSWVSQPGAPLAFDGYSHDVAFSPDGSRVAVANLDGVPHVFDVRTGELVFNLKGHSTVAGGLAYSPDGSQIATGDNGLGEVIVWDANTGEQLLVLAGETRGIYSMAYSPDGSKVAAVGDDGVLHVWDANTGEKLISPVTEKAGFRAVVFSHDGEYIYTGGQDSTVRIWDVATGDNLKTLVGHSGVVISLALSPDGQFLASGCPDELKYWELSPGKELFVAPFIYPSGGGITLTPDGSTLVANGSTKTINLYNPLNGEQLDTFMQVELAEGEQLGRLVFTPDGKYLIAAVSNGDLIVFDYESREQVMTLRGHTGAILGADISSDGRYLVTSGFDNKAIVWDLNSGELVTEYTGHAHWVLDVIFSLDDKQVISASADGTVHVWDLQSGETLRMVPAVGGLGAIEITSDGKYVIGATIDGYVSIWDAHSWEEILVFLAHTSGSWDSALSADGSRLVTAGFEGSAKVWKIPSGEPVATLYGHQAVVAEVEISPDGKIVYTGSHGGLLRGFLVDVDELVQLAESRLTRSFTQEECQTYLHLDQCPEE